MGHGGLCVGVCGSCERSACAQSAIVGTILENLEWDGGRARKVGDPRLGLSPRRDLGPCCFVLVEVYMLLIVCGSGCICVVIVRVLEVSMGL